MNKIILCTFVFAGIAAAQPLGLGVKVGVPLTDALTVESPNPFDYTASTNRYVIGPYGEIRLPGGFAVEIDALYRSYGFSSIPIALLPSGGALGPIFVNPSIVPSRSVSVGSWEFPVLAKYRFFGGPIRPYIDGGVVLSRLTGVNDIVELNHRSNYGIALGAGVDLHLLFLHITPEIRYDGFVFRNFSSSAEALRSNRNQAFIMVGIGF
ncbi:MAG: outer membrane beta-barrel protein [Bryobacteraceae bacterium]